MSKNKHNLEMSRGNQCFLSEQAFKEIKELSQRDESSNHSVKSSNKEKTKTISKTQQDLELPINEEIEMEGS
jgi:hypothetical protein